jgi:hypothetical protein
MYIFLNTNSKLEQIKRREVKGGKKKKKSKRTPRKGGGYKLQLSHTLSTLSTFSFIFVDVMRPEMPFTVCASRHQKALVST